MSRQRLPPGIYRRDISVMDHREPAPEPVEKLERGIRLILDEESYLDISLDPHMGELVLHTSGSGLEHILARPAGSANGLNLRIERRSGSVYMGQAPEPREAQNARDRLDELGNIRVALQNAAQRHQGGLDAERCGELAEALHNILTGRKQAKGS